MRKLGLLMAVALLAVAVPHSTNVVQAQNDTLSVATLKAAPLAAAETEAYWTPERFANAQPMPLPTVAAAPSLMSGGAGVTYGVPRSSPAQEPESGAASPVQLFDLSLLKAPAASDITPDDLGTYGNAHYTSSRLIPLTADKQYPYKTVGKLFFTEPGVGDFVCSASVISYRIVATAGHCVADGLGHWYTNWVFVPAYRDGAAPYQAWNWVQVATTGTWFSGGGTVPNAADYAMIVVADRYFGSKLTKIGKKLGFLGWQTLSLVHNHATLLGYPCNLDSCQKMHQTNSADVGYDPFGGGTGVYGTDHRGGSSGGPWVQNFGVWAVGESPGGLNPGLNRVIAVTSWGYTSTDPKVQGASVPDDRWVAVWNLVCAGQGNCTK